MSVLVALMSPGFALAGPPASVADAPAELGLAAHQGDVVVVDFWASWCKPCQASLPWLTSMQARHRDDGLSIVTVNVDHDRKLADRFLAGLSTTLPVVYDPQGKIAETYDLPGMPTSFVYDRAGHLRATHLGFEPETVAERESELASLLHEEVDHAK